MAYTHGIDISKWQGDVDFARIKKATQFAIIKATEGVGYTDPKFKRNQEGFRNVGLPLGYYHFARPDLGNSAIAEADWFLKTVGNLRDGEILALDYEVSYGDPVNWCKAFLDRIKEKLGGYKPLIYINLSLNNNYSWSSVVKGDYGLWLAYYMSDGNNGLNSADKPAPATDWAFTAMRQYSSSGKVDGISGNVDMNTFYGDVPTLLKYGYKSPVVAPTPEPIPEPPVEPSELEKVKKELEIANTTIKTITEEKKLVEAELKTEKEESKELSNNYDVLFKEKERLATEKNEAIRLLSEYKNSDMGKLVVTLYEIWKQLKAKLSKK